MCPYRQKIFGLCFYISKSGHARKFEAIYLDVSSVDGSDNRAKSDKTIKSTVLSGLDGRFDRTGKYRQKTTNRSNTENTYK